MTSAGDMERAARALRRAANAIPHVPAAKRASLKTGILVLRGVVMECGGPLDDTDLGRTLPKPERRYQWHDTVAAVNKAIEALDITVSLDEIPNDFRGVSLCRRMADWCDSQAKAMQR